MIGYLLSLQLALARFDAEVPKRIYVISPCVHFKVQPGSWSKDTAAVYQSIKPLSRHVAEGSVQRVLNAKIMLETGVSQAASHFHRIGHGVEARDVTSIGLFQGSHTRLSCQRRVIGRKNI